MALIIISKRRNDFIMESDPLSGGIAFQLLFLVFLTAVNAFFAGAEMAVVSVTVWRSRAINALR